MYLVIVRIKKMPMNPWRCRQKGGFVALLHIPITCYLLHTYRRGGGGGGRNFPKIKVSV